MDNLRELKDKIELLTPDQQIGVGRLLYDNKVIMIENKNGVFVNLTDITDEIVDKIQYYMVHLSQQEKTIEELELKKQQFKDNFFTSSNSNHELCDD